MNHTIGVMGLGVMGSSIALNMASKGEDVAVYNYTRDLTDQLLQKSEKNKFIPIMNCQQFVQSLQSPRKIFLMVTAGKVVDTVISSLIPHVRFRRYHHGRRQFKLYRHST